jgi:hypothetical protein
MKAKLEYMNGKWKAAGVVAAAGSVALVAQLTTPGSIPSLACPFKTVTGLDCPLCGGTRATYALLDGDFFAAIDYNVFAVFVVLPALLFFLGWSAITLWKENKWKFPSATWAFIALMGVFWLVRNLPFSWAEPLRS